MRASEEEIAEMNRRHLAIARRMRRIALNALNRQKRQKRGGMK
jgi:hypothetical protein